MTVVPVGGRAEFVKVETRYLGDEEREVASEFDDGRDWARGERRYGGGRGDMSVRE